MLRRTKVFRLFSLFIFLTLVLRIYSISVCNKELSLLADKQNFISIMSNNNRNDIVDRNGKTLTGVEKKLYGTVFSTNNPDLDFKIAKVISETTDISEYVIYNDLHKDKKAVFEITDKEKTDNLNKYKNIFIYEQTERYPDKCPAASLIGYLSDGEGVTGLEKIYDDLLRNNKQIFKIFTDPYNTTLKSFDSYEESDIKLQTTIDVDYQKICNEVLENSNMPSGAVLIDVESFEVLAISSFPSFQQNSLSDYIAKNDGSFNNRCLQLYDMGSIFKIVVTAAALENGVTAEKNYECTGSTNIYGQKINCHNLNGHGKLNFEESFEKSCNPAFIDIGNELGYTKILDMAEKFGFGKNIIIPEELGSVTLLPDRNNYYLSDLANVSIGQGKLNCNVVQGAALSAVIANGGIMKKPILVNGFYNNAGEFVEINRDLQESKRIISIETAENIRKMMKDTCKNGTGVDGNIDIYGAGGKTGSAQTGWLKDGEFYQHAWFTGFFPADNPRFALCVFVENGKSGSVTAAPLFKKIGEKVLKIYK